jgi:hypothetical protein
MSNTIHPMRFERILLELGSCPAETASHMIRTAADLARVFDADIGALFVEEEQLFDLADLPLAGAPSAPKLAPSERSERQLMEAAVTRQGRSCRRVLSLLANAANVRWSFEVARGDPLHVIQRIAGPRDFLMLTGATDTISGRSMLALARQALAMAPAVLITASLARHRSGPVALIEGAAQEPGTLGRFAKQVASGLREELVVLSIQADDATMAESRHSAFLHSSGTPASLGAAMSLPAIKSALREIRPRLLISELAVNAVSDHSESLIAFMRAAGAPAIFLPRELRLVP